MRILYICLSCGPNLGSEDAVGWNVPMEMSARGHEVFVLTRSDKVGEIEAYKASHPDLTYPEFRYQPLSAFAEKCKGSLYSLRAKLWCGETAAVVRDLCAEIKPDVVHQLTPVEFRTPVDLSGIDAMKILGPVGGGGNMPHSLVSYVSARGRAIELLRSLANSLALLTPSVKRAYSSYDLVFSANVETSTVIAPMCRGEVVLRPEVAAKRLLPVVESSREPRDSLVVGFAGRLHYRKGVVLLLDCVQQMSTPFQLLVAGDGEERPRIEAGIRERHLEGRVELLGRIPYDDMADFYRRIDVLAFPSFREATGSVVVEALAAGVPVVSLGIFGASVVLADNPDFLVKCEGDSCDVVDRYAATLDSYARGELVFDWSSRERLLIGELASFFEDSYRAGVTL